jgi:hypothetical protein
MATPATTTPLVGITVDDAQYNELLAIFGGDHRKTQKAMTRAINRTGQTGVTRIARKVGTILNVKVSKLKATPKNTSGVIGFRRATWETLAGTIRIKGTTISLRDFKGLKVTKDKGVSIQFRLDKPRLTFSRAFEAKGKIRERAKGRDKAGKLNVHGVARRLHVEELRAPSLLSDSMLGRTGATQLAGEVIADLRDVLTKNINSQIDGILNRKKAVRTDDTTLS